MKRYIPYLSRGKLILVLILGLALTPSRARAQLLEVKQTVFGMDCAPCAYGLEKRLERLDGIANVHVSLNDGLASTELVEGSRIKLSTIREAIRQSGFSAEDAVIRATGNLKQDGSHWTFELPSGEFFVLQQIRTEMRTKRELKPGRATITGRVTAENPDEAGGYGLEIFTIATS